MQEALSTQHSGPRLPSLLTPSFLAGELCEANRQVLHEESPFHPPPLPSPVSARMGNSTEKRRPEDLSERPRSGEAVREQRGSAGLSPDRDRLLLTAGDEPGAVGRGVAAVPTQGSLQGALHFREQDRGILTCWRDSKVGTGVARPSDSLSPPYLPWAPGLPEPRPAP